MKKVTINIPIELPKEFLDQGAIELYATKFAGWTPQKSETPQEACGRHIQEFIEKGYKDIMIDEAKKEAAKNADTRFNKMFNKKNDKSV